ncbi:MAG: Wzt carbohydrate-binding domain-containing protein [Dokdonella sp.]
MSDSQAIAAATADSSVAREPILFLHLPKTAGTALRNLFIKHLGEEHVSRGLNMRLDEALVHYADLDAICGHFHAEHGHSLPVDRFSITVLRDPVDRFLSSFYFRKFDAQKDAVDQRVRSMDIDQFIDGLTDSDIDELNVQTFMLYPLGTESMALLSRREQVAAAKRALDCIDYVGIHDEIDDFVCMICARMGWPADAALERVNATSQRLSPEQLSSASRRKLDDVLQYDCAVYQYAIERFTQLRRESIISAPTRRANIECAAAPRVAAARPRPPAPAPREFGDRRVELVNVRIIGEMSGESLALIGERISVHIQFVAHEAVDGVTAEFLIRDERGLPVFGTNTHLLGDAYRVTPGTYAFTFSFLNRIECGAYTVDARLIRNGSYLVGCYHWKDKVARFDVNGWGAQYFAGRVMMDASASLAQVSEEGSIGHQRVLVDSSKPALLSGRLNPPLQDFSARLSPLSTVLSTHTGAELLVEIEVENTGGATWQVSGKNPVCLSYHWHDREGNVVENDGLRTYLPRDLNPGQRMKLVGLLRAPDRIGDLRLIWTMVQEGVSWFDSRDAQSKFSVDVTVC